MKTWFTFKNAADDASVVDIHIIDFIGSWDDDWLARNWGYEMGVTARQFVEELAKLPTSVKALNVHINSPGGDVQGGVNIANALRNEQTSKGRKVETYIDGIAASIASVIAMAGSKVHIADNALVMVHNPWGLAIGDAGELRKTADILDTMRNQIVASYKWHSPLEDSKLVALMDAETWMDADEALANGLATDKVQGLAAAASINRRGAAKLNVPEKFKARVNAWLEPESPAPPAAASAAEVLRLCREGECLDLAEGLLAANATLADATAKVTTEKQARADRKKRADAITKLCADAKVPELTGGYIAGAMTVEAVKGHLATITAKLDKAEIDTGLSPDAGQQQVAAGWKQAFARVNRPFGGGARQ